MSKNKVNLNKLEHLSKPLLNYLKEMNCPYREIRICPDGVFVLEVQVGIPTKK